MIGNTARAEQFQSRSGNESTKGSRKGFGLLGGGEDPLAHLTPEQQRDCLVAHLRSLKILRTTPGGKCDKGLGIEISEIELRISAIRKKSRSARPDEIPGLFMAICHERMSKLEFDRILTEANRRQRTEGTKR